jgi:hypothetical protein
MGCNRPVEGLLCRFTFNSISKKNMTVGKIVWLLVLYGVI